jgi:hypothetical protein
MNAVHIGRWRNRRERTHGRPRERPHPCVGHRRPGFDEFRVIAVTDRAMHGDRDKGIGPGSADDVTKPVDTEVVWISCQQRQDRRS